MVVAGSRPLKGGWEAPTEQQFLIVSHSYGRAFLASGLRSPPGKLAPALGGPRDTSRVAPFALRWVSGGRLSSNTRSGRGFKVTARSRQEACSPVGLAKSVLEPC